MNGTETGGRKISRRDLLSIGFKTGSLIGLAKIGISCSENDSSGSNPTASKEATSQSPYPAKTVIETSEPSPTQTPTQTETQPTPPCQILEDKYCNSAKLVEWKNSIDQTFKIVSLNLPTGVPIFAPFDGSFTYSDGPGNLIDPNVPAAVVYRPASDADQSNLTFTVMGDIEFNKKRYNLNKGDIVATTGNSGLKVLGGTVAIMITSLDPERNIFTTDEPLLENLFPDLVK